MAPDAGAAINEWRVGPDRIVGPLKEIKAEEALKLNAEYLDWTLTIANQTAQPIEIGDLALPLSMAEGTPPGRGQIYTQKLIRHSFIAGNGSWVYWQRANADGPFHNYVLSFRHLTRGEFTQTSKNCLAVLDYD